MHPLRPPEYRHYVYAAFCEDRGGQGYVKIGRSGAIRERLGSLRSSSPIPIKMAAIINVPSFDKSVAIEKDLHKAFKDRKENGEWFRFDFSSPKDKEDFNSFSRLVFSWHLLRCREQWWTKINTTELFRDGDAAQAAALRTGHARAESNRRRKNRRSKKAFKELAAYGT